MAQGLGRVGSESDRQHIGAGALGDRAGAIAVGGAIGTLAVGLALRPVGAVAVGLARAVAPGSVQRAWLVWRVR